MKPVYKISALIAGLLVCSLTQAQTKTNQQLTDELTVLQQGVNQVQRDMQKLERLLENRAMLELFQRMDELSEEVSQLRGMLEQQGHDLAGIKKRQRELYLDIDRRLRELENTSTRAPVPVTPLPALTTPDTPVSPSAPSVQSTQQKPQTTPRPAPQASEKPKPATVAAPGKRTVPVSEERAAYQKAFDMLKEGRYKMANTSFKTFLGNFPQSSYAGNAQYWLGESNYVTRQFEQAIKEFEAVLSKYPTSNKVPDAMLKLGYTYYELGQFNNARNILEQLQKKAPNSTAARLAGKRLNRMKQEGR